MMYSFLGDEDVHILLFTTVVRNAKETISYPYDTDGIVLQLKNLTTVKESIHYLRVGKFVGAKLQIHWHSLKKHLPLAEYSTAGVSAVNKIFRHTLAFVDGGYLLNICWISAENKSPHPVFQTEVSREPTLPK